eukprot:8171103-Pyramimonas_sp.AAC.1
MAIAQLCINAYRGARYLCIPPMVSGLHYAWQGAIAGCSFATTFARIYLLGPCEQLVSRLPAS